MSKSEKELCPPNLFKFSLSGHLGQRLAGKITPVRRLQAFASETLTTAGSSQQLLDKFFFFRAERSFLHC